MVSPIETSLNKKASEIIRLFLGAEKYEIKFSTGTLDASTTEALGSTLIW